MYYQVFSCYIGGDLQLVHLREEKSVEWTVNGTVLYNFKFKDETAIETFISNMSAIIVGYSSGNQLISNNFVAEEQNTANLPVHDKKAVEKLSSDLDSLKVQENENTTHVSKLPHSGPVVLEDKSKYINISETNTGIIDNGTKNNNTGHFEPNVTDDDLPDTKVAEQASSKDNENEILGTPDLQCSEKDSLIIGLTTLKESNHTLNSPAKLNVTNQSQEVCMYVYPYILCMYTVCLS